jgi:3-hydroxyisobutyrate dehydrogenase-like beta-hydroxyacid dehydrogenase
MKAGMIGLGAMGLGMARNLAKAGYKLKISTECPTKIR